MSDISKEAVDALLQGVTDGPWFEGGHNGGGRATMVYSDDATGSAVADTVLSFVYRREGEAEANARFIAAARELVPALRAALDEAEARAVKAEAERDAANALLRSIRTYIATPAPEEKVTDLKADLRWIKRRIDAHLGAKP